jgi:hypothetical protein
MVELLRHRQTKEAATDMFSLKPPRHISTLPDSGGIADIPEPPLRAISGLMNRTRESYFYHSAAASERRWWDLQCEWWSWVATAEKIGDYSFGVALTC